MDDGALIREAAERAARGERFAMAIVVRRTAPSSARTGQKALILADGTLRGWLGGACIEPTVRREALEALEDGRPRFVIFAPDGPEEHAEAAARRDTVAHPMTCHSGGTVEIYVEPQLPAPTLIVFGDSPVTRALATMAPAAGYAVRVAGAGETSGADPGIDGFEEREPRGATPGARPAAGADDEPLAAGRGDSSLFAVVATMGERDEEAAQQALAAGAAYVGVVSSPRRAAEIRRRLADRGVDEEALVRLVGPAGLDLGAESPGEIAVSILAELVELRRRGRRQGDREEPAPADPPAEGRAARGPGLEPGRKPATAVDPVCGMEVEVERAHHTYRHAGNVYYFCCPRCQERFSGDPDRFVAA